MSCEAQPAASSSSAASCATRCSVVAAPMRWARSNAEPSKKHAMLRRVRQETDVVGENDAGFYGRWHRRLGGVQRGQRRELQGSEDWV